MFIFQLAQFVTYVMCVCRWFSANHYSFWNGLKELIWGLIPILNFTYVWDMWADFFKFIILTVVGIFAFFFSTFEAVPLTNSNPTPVAQSTAVTLPRPSPVKPQVDNSLTEKEVFEIVKHFRNCWILPTEKEASELAIPLEIIMKRDGSVESASAIDHYRYESDLHYQKAVDSAVQSALNCKPAKMLDIKKYSFWKTLKLEFNPSPVLPEIQIEEQFQREPSESYYRALARQWIVVPNPKIQKDAWMEQENIVFDLPNLKNSKFQILNGRWKSVTKVLLNKHEVKGLNDTDLLNLLSFYQLPTSALIVLSAMNVKSDSCTVNYSLLNIESDTQYSITKIAQDDGCFMSFKDIKPNPADHSIEIIFALDRSSEVITYTYQNETIISKNTRPEARIINGAGVDLPLIN